MNILFISRELSGGDMAYRLTNEGHSVKLYIEEQNQKQNLTGFIKKTSDWKSELPWVGRKGLIIIDDTGFGKLQDQLRRDGFSVVGGSEQADRIEDARDYGQKILASCGIETVPCVNFPSAKEAARYVEKNKGAWVIKQNGHVSKGFNYVGQMGSGEDVIQVLRNYNRYNKGECSPIALHQRIEGIEIGVARYFNGQDWIGPIEINVEHKNLCNGTLGPKTQEMGTVLWYTEDENNGLYKTILAKLKPYLAKINFHGDVDVNCMVTENTAYPLEITARFGWPATHAQEELHLSPWGDFLKAVADGKDFVLQYKTGFAIVILVATPPFPYFTRSLKNTPRGMEVFFKKKLNPEELNHFHFEEVSLRRRNGMYVPYISSKTGSVLHVGEIGQTVEDARKRVYELIDQLIIPKMFYRTDIGIKFAEINQEKLVKDGWI